MKTLNLVPVLRAVCLLALLAVLAACATGPGGAPVGSSTAPRELQVFQGTLQNVDHGNHRLLLRDDAEGGRTLDMAYDRFSQLDVDGRPHPLTGLEPGDRIRAEVERSERGWRVAKVDLLADARAGGAAVPSGGVQFDGAVGAIDTVIGLLTVTEGGFTGNARKVKVDRNTRIDGAGGARSLTDLRRGDMVRVQGRQQDGQTLASQISVQSRAGGN